MNTQMSGSVESTSVTSSRCGTFSGLLSSTAGQRKKPTAAPTKDALAMAVTVVRWRGGNHSAESRDGAAMSTCGGRCQQVRWMHTRERAAQRTGSRGWLLTGPAEPLMI